MSQSSEVTTDSAEAAARLTTARETGGAVVVYGDFACPWSYLAARRADVLEAAGLLIDWRAVEAEDRVPWLPHVRQHRLAAVREQMPHVLAALLPDEVLPYSLVGAVPFSRAACSAYAEAYAAGVAANVRQLLFRAFWMHGFDLDDGNALRTLLIDRLLDSDSPSHVVAEWGMVPDAAGGPISTAAWRLARAWRSQWETVSSTQTPLVVVGGHHLYGARAAAWLGTQTTRRGLEPNLLPQLATTTRPVAEYPHVSWVTQNGGRWLRDASRDRSHLPWDRRPR